jgi:hypothetical protein
LSTERIGAVLVGGSEAGALDGETHAMAPRKELVVHPAAGELPLWQLAQWVARMGATSWSKTGVNVGSGRSDEHPPLSHTSMTMGPVHLTKSAAYWGRIGRLTGGLPVSATIES